KDLSDAYPRVRAYQHELSSIVIDLAFTAGVSKDRDLLTEAIRALDEELARGPSDPIPEAHILIADMEFDRAECLSSLFEDQRDYKLDESIPKSYRKAREVLESLDADLRDVPMIRDRIADAYFGEASYLFVKAPECPSFLDCLNAAIDVMQRTATDNAG